MTIQSIRSLTITTLVENSAMSSLLGQWGLSFLLEITDSKDRKRKMILDTGKDKHALLQNIRLLKKDLKNVECIVLSHGHLDHTAATAEIVKSSGGIKVYAHPHTFLSRYHESKDGKKRQIGVPEGEGIAEIEKAGGKVVLTSRPTEILLGLWTTGQIPRTTKFENVMDLPKGDKLVISVDGEKTEDRILDDQALYAHVKGVGLYAITGCAHSGFINTLLYVQKMSGFEQVAAMVGGTHLVGRSDKYTERTITELRRFGMSLISPCHCTGFKAQTRLWEAFPSAFVVNYSGRVIEAGKEPEPRLI
jgi:7,8-dihydropterin-6-yl-methyl-4-(beta-D-ribofuranosyl)aminobenzene 5'-phosphate synthase